MKYTYLFDFWMVMFNRIGMQNMRSSDQWVNGVNEDELLVMVSSEKGGTTEQDNYSWDNFQAGIR